MIVAVIVEQEGVGFPFALYGETKLSRFMSMDINGASLEHPARVYQETASRRTHRLGMGRPPAVDRVNMHVSSLVIHLDGRVCGQGRPRAQQPKPTASVMDFHMEEGGLQEGAARGVLSAEPPHAGLLHD
jgi:hypothetical protein